MRPDNQSLEQGMVSIGQCGAGFRSLPSEFAAMREFDEFVAVPSARKIT
jgi:hypothetical protein